MCEVSVRRVPEKRIAARMHDPSWRSGLTFLPNAVGTTGDREIAMVVPIHMQLSVCPNHFRIKHCSMPGHIYPTTNVVWWMQVNFPLYLASVKKLFEWLRARGSLVILESWPICVSVILNCNACCDCTSARMHGERLEKLAYPCCSLWHGNENCISNMV